MTKCQKDKDQNKERSVFWCQGNFALLRCFETCFPEEEWDENWGQMPGGEEAGHVHAEEAKPLPPGCALPLAPCSLNLALWFWTLHLETWTLHPFSCTLSQASLHLNFSVIRRPGSDVVHVNGENLIHMFRLFRLIILFHLFHIIHRVWLSHLIHLFFLR